MVGTAGVNDGSTSKGALDRHWLEKQDERERGADGEKTERRGHE
jgi:hypothetical protein